MKCASWLVAPGMLASALAPLARCDVKLAPLFGDGMVLQRGAKVPVWGSAAPGEKIEVRIDGQNVEAVADAAGRWRATLAPLASTEPRELTVAGATTIVLRDVLAGDVWVCSGQSNMEWPLSKCSTPDVLSLGERDAQGELRHPVRLFQVAHAIDRAPREDCSGRWMLLTPENAAEFSAVGLAFGAAMTSVESCPIGLVQATWGGTPAESWMGAEMFGDAPLFQDVLARRARMLRGEEPLDPHVACTLYDGMIAPLTQFPIRGVIWYQGESNVERALQYRQLFPALIRGWRKEWGQGDFPFVFVQLASFRPRMSEPGESWIAELRDAQAAALELPATGMAVTLDVGDEKDIHPPDKRTVGQRLADIMSRWVHRTGVAPPPLSPQFREIERDLTSISIRFCCGDESGLSTIDGKPPRGFAIAGEDRVFHWADAEIAGSAVKLSSSAVPRPIAVRYAWADNPDVNLVYVSAGRAAPAAPFRTDKWPLSEEQGLPKISERRPPASGK